MSLEDKIKALEEEIKATPHNKATEAHLGRLKAKLAELKEELKRTRAKKKAARIKGIKKVGDATIVLIGPKEERTAILNQLSGSSGSIGTLIHKGAHIQILNPEEEQLASAAHISELMVSVGDFKIENMPRKVSIPILRIEKENTFEIAEKIFTALNLMRVYTKEPGKKADMSEPLILKKGSSVADVCETLRKEEKDFSFARVWGSSAKFAGQRVGLDHILQEEDVVELSFKK